MDPYVGEIRMFAGARAPQNWHFCDGTALSIQTYQTLYSLIGTTYGGSGPTFNLPDFRGRLPIGQGQGSGLTNRMIGQSGGVSTVALTEANIPAHSHAFNASTATATTPSVTSGVGLATPTSPVVRYAPPGATPAPTPVSLDDAAITAAPGGGEAHLNVMPYLAINYIICVDGLYPMRPN